MTLSPNRDENLTRQPAGKGPIQIMLVDDSAVIRGLIARMIDPEPDMTVVASVADGQQAIDRLARSPSIDVILLDIEMPVMDGITALPKLVEINRDVKIVMASTLTLENAEISMKAMQLGATDYVPKPTSTRNITGASDFKRELLDKVRAVTGRVAAPQGTAAAPSPAGQPRSLYAKTTTLRDKPAVHRKPEILVIGSSTGGPPALLDVLKRIKPDVRQPILIAQHMPATFTTILAKHLASASGRPCAEARDGEPLSPGKIYVAPGNYHMVVEKPGVNAVLRLNQDPPENFCRPAVDPLFRSVAAVYGDRVLATVLTGMGADGCKGADQIVGAGGTVIAQDEATSVVWGMPGAVATEGLCTAVLPLDRVADYINTYVGEGVP